MGPDLAVTEAILRFTISSIDLSNSSMDMGGRGLAEVSEIPDVIDAAAGGVHRSEVRVIAHAKFSGGGNPASLA